MVYSYIRKVSRNSATRYVLCFAAFALTVHMFRTATLWIGTKSDDINQRAVWLEQTKVIPSKEYDALLTARFERPSVWPNYTLPKWRATYAQQRELNDVIRSALTNGKEGNNNNNNSADRLVMRERRKRIAAVTKSVWEAYRRDAFGYDEYHPASHSGTNHTRQGVGYFIADVLDTLWLMELRREYAEGRDFLSRISYDQPGSVSLFETTIRVLGGLLSAFHLSGESDTGLLRLADELGAHLSRSFNTASGIPPETAFLQHEGPVHAYDSSTAEVTTLQLEFRYLAKLTGKHMYRRCVDKIMNITFEAPKWDGLVPIYINANTKQFAGDVIRLGSRGDSYYEYLLKQWLQTRQTEPRFRAEYDAAMEGVKRYLVAVSPSQNLTFVGELLSPRNTSPVFSPKMDHLVCFLGGNLALGATQGRSLSEMSPRSLTARDREDLVLARQLTETCVQMYFDTPSKLAPEIAYFRWIDPATGTEWRFDANTQLIKPHGDIIVPFADRHNLLRPETVESLFILWRITGESKWRDYGWRIFEALERWARLPDGGGAYANLHDVTVIPPQHADKMETFFVSETLKYLYLLFSPSDVVPLSRYVFNTEAHPLPLFTWDHS